MPGIPQYSDSINDVPITQQLAQTSSGGSNSYCSGYFPTLVQIDGLYINAQKITWTEDPNIEKHSAPGRDGDILHHLGWHSRTVKIDAEIAGTSAGNVISSMHQKARTKNPVSLTISTLVDKSINGSYVIESFSPSSSTRNPVNVADYAISLLSFNNVTAAASTSYVADGSNRLVGSYTNDATEGVTWTRSSETAEPVATTAMMQSIGNMATTQWGAEIGVPTEDYQVVSTFSSNTPVTKWTQSNLGNSSTIIVQQYSNGYMAYNRENARVGWINSGAVPTIGPEYTLDQSYFDETTWNMVTQWERGNVVEVYQIENWEITSGVEIDMGGNW